MFDRRDRLLDRSSLLLQLLGGGRLLLVAGQRREHIAVVVVRFDVLKEGRHAVVVALGDRVQLVVVAPSTVHGQAQEDLAGRGDHIVQLVRPRLSSVGRFVVPQPQPIEAGGDDRIGGDLVQFVARQLFAQELVEGLVLVERADHVVAVPPHLWLGIVPFETVRFGIADQVQPVAAPFFAILWRVQQAVDDGFPRPGRIVGQKTLHIGRLGGKTGQVVGAAAQQSDLVGLPVGRQALPLEPAEHKRIDRGPDPVRGLDLGRCGAAERLEGPVPLPDGPRADPFSQDLDFGRRQPLVVIGRRHPQVFVVGRNPVDQLALFRLAADHRPIARIQFGQHSLFGIQPQAGLARRFVGSVAGETASGEDRLDLSSKKLSIPGIPGIPGRRGRCGRGDGLHLVAGRWPGAGNEQDAGRRDQPEIWRGEEHGSVGGRGGGWARGRSGTVGRRGHERDAARHFIVARVRLACQVMTKPARPQGCFFPATIRLAGADC